LAVETAGMTIVDVLDGGIGFEAGVFETSSERLILEPIPLLVHQQGETLFEAEAGSFGIFQLAANGFGHAGQFHRIQFLDRRLH
jgi:hypothetical protein